MVKCLPAVQATWECTERVFLMYLLKDVIVC